MVIPSQIEGYAACNLTSKSREMFPFQMWPSSLKVAIFHLWNLSNVAIFTQKWWELEPIVTDFAAGWAVGFQ